MNPCPCGFAGALPEGRCRCPVPLVERYERRVSGPLRDRIDLWVRMPRVAPAALVGGPEPESSAVVAARIRSARNLAMDRRGSLNAALRGRHLRAACGLDGEARRRLADLVEADASSARGTERLLRVARTIADLGGAGVVRVEHLEEAAWFRSAAARTEQALAS